MNYSNQIKELILSDSYLLSDQKPSDWAEEKRVMTSDVSSRPGPYEYSFTPYLREVVDCLAPDHPAQKIAVQKGAQIGFSAGIIENGIGWIMDKNPGNILMLSGDKDLSREAMETKIDQMIDSCGLRSLIRPNAIRKRNQRTGDTSKGKEFPGGKLIADSVQIAAKMKQRSVKYGFIDDFDSAEANDKKEGNIRTLIEQRFASYAHSMKLFYISTPLIAQTSNIEPAYLLGDQRRYHIPCPCCGDMIFLEWRIQNGDIKGGIYYELDEGKLIRESVGYKCQSCGDVFDDKDKAFLLNAGQWIPTAEPSEPSYYSYHISALYAPPGMYDWLYYVVKYLEACPPGGEVDKGALRSFYNVVLGKTWKEQGTSIKMKNLMEKNIRDYKPGIIPSSLCQRDGNGLIVMLICTCDLNGTMDDARLDWEIVAHSEMGPTYSVDHGSIGTFIPASMRTKATDEVDSERLKWNYRREGQSVWPAFDEVRSKGYLTDDGRTVHVMVTGVDTGRYTIQAYDFIDNADGVIWALKGDKEDTARKHGIDLPFFKQGRERDNLYLVEVNQVKTYLADKLALNWNENSDTGQPSGFMNYPQPEDGKYSYKNFFKHYESEHYVAARNKDGSVKGFVWQKKKSNAQNHFWDVRVYNDAVREIFVSEYLRHEGIKRGSWKAFVDKVLGRD